MGATPVASLQHFQEACLDHHASRAIAGQFAKLKPEAGSLVNHRGDEIVEPNENGSCSLVSAISVTNVGLERDKRVPRLLPELGRCPVVYDAAVEVDVLVVALGLLSDLQLHVE